MALALGLYLTDTLHLFFLFVPVYVLTVVLYIALAFVAGAQTTIPQPGAGEPESNDCALDASDNAALNATGPSSGADRAFAFWASGIAALAALAVCAAFALYVYFAPRRRLRQPSGVVQAVADRADTCVFRRRNVLACAANARPRYVTGE